MGFNLEGNSLMAEHSFSAAASPSTQPSTIVRGPNGIRAGWRVLIFLALVCGVVLALFVGLKIFTHGQAQVGVQVSGATPLGLALLEGPLLCFTAIPALIMARIERRSWGQYGLPARTAFGKNFWIGGVAGFVAISGALLGIFLLHGFRLAGLAIHGSTIVSSTLAWGATFVLVGLAEEFSFRGYLQFTLGEGIGFWFSAILLSLLFAFAHSGNPGESKAGLLAIIPFGLLFCLFLRRTGDLWLAVGFHAGWDWGQTFFYGVPDSGIAAYHNLFNSNFSGPNWLTGGSVGPEASIFTPITLAIVAIIFVRICRKPRSGVV